MAWTSEYIQSSTIKIFDIIIPLSKFSLIKFNPKKQTLYISCTDFPLQQKHIQPPDWILPRCHGPVSLEPVGLDHFPSPRWRPPGSRLPKAWFWCCSDTPRWWHCHKSTPGSFGNPMIAGGGWEEWWALEKLENTKSIRDSSHINIYHKKSARHKSSS